jgi:hypothetical protein
VLDVFAVVGRVGIAVAMAGEALVDAGELQG